MDQPNHVHVLAGGTPPLLEHSRQQPLGSVWERHSNLQIACMILSIFFWFFSFTAAFCAITISRSRYSGQHKRSQSSRLSPDQAPGVSIIRPLRGIDSDMYENLASSFRQDYPRFEIIFSVAQANDPAIAVVQDLMKKFPRVDARLIIGEKDVGINPKINNMIQSYETAKHDILWVLDSNVYVDPGCMGRSADKMMQPGVGLVHHLPFGVRPHTLGSELELMFLDTVHAKMYLFINWTGLASCVVGKSNLYRRSDLDKVGGLAKFGKYMAEDNLVATEIFNMGYKHEMTSDLAYQSLGSMTPSDYFLRRARWTRIRKYTVTAATVVEPFIEMVGCGLVASYGFNLLWQTHFLNFLAFHIVIWFLIDLSMYQALSGEKVDDLRGFLMAWCLREMAALPLYMYAVVGSTVEWRDQTFLLHRDGTVHSLDGVSPPAAASIRGTNTESSSPLSSSSSGSSSGSSAREGPTETTTKIASTLSSSTSSTSTTLANIANTVVPESTQASLRNFFRRPAVISIVSSTFAVIHFAVDILLKSQRNGNEDEEEELSEDEIEDALFAGEVLVADGANLEGPIMKLKKTPAKKPHLQQRRSSSGGSTNGKNRSAKPDDHLYDGDDNGIAAGDGGAFLPRRSARIRMMRTKVLAHADGESETEAEHEHGRWLASTEEDALSKAVEPYLSDSLSRRGRI